jgi:heptosyltransferase I
MSGASATRATVRASLDRVCIVMMSAVGDAVHVLPVLTALKRHRPDAAVTWILQPGPATLVRGHPDLNEIMLFERCGANCPRVASISQSHCRCISRPA